MSGPRPDETPLTETPLTEATLRVLLADAGLVLEGKALDAALQGARHLRAEIARLDAWLAKADPDA